MDISIKYDNFHPSGQTIPTMNKNSNIKMFLDADKERTVDFIMKRLL